MSEVFTKIHDISGGFAVERVQDVEPLIDYAKGARDSGDVGSSEMRHAASIPMVLVEAYCNDKGISFPEFMANPEHIRSMCNDPGLRDFRIWNGRV